jgi:transcription termination factor Rho
MNSRDSAIGAPLELDGLLRQDYATLAQLAAELGVTTGPQPDTDRLRMAFVEHHLAAGGRAIGEGILQVLPEGFGFLRAAANDFAERPTDAYVSPAQIRALDLRTGHRLRGPVRPPRGNERSLALEHVDTVQGRAAGEHRRPPPFEAHVPVLPDRRLPLAGDRPGIRLLEMLAPWCHGHRVLVAAPRAAATAQFAAELAHAVCSGGEGAPRCSVLLFDHRPEAIATARAMLATTGADVVATDFAQPPSRTLDAAELALAAACRDVEAGRDAVLLVDSLTAWVRLAARAAAPSGRWAAPGLDAQALSPAKRLFASARQLAGGAALTVISFVHDGDDGALDRAIREEFQPASNSLVTLLAADDAFERSVESVPFAVRGTKTRPEADPRPAADRQRVEAARAEVLSLPHDEQVRRLLALAGG